jgi:hypothetical protein
VWAVASGTEGRKRPAMTSEPTQLPSCIPPYPVFNSTMPRRSRTPEESTAHTTSRQDAHDNHRSHDHSRRSRSPRRDDNDGHRHKRRRSRSPTAKPVVLPYKAKPLSKRQYGEYRPLFQSYLDIQKQIQLDDLDEREVKGRWKSFISRWYAHLSRSE